MLEIGENHDTSFPAFHTGHGLLVMYEQVVAAFCVWTTLKRLCRLSIHYRRHKYSCHDSI